MKSLLTPGTIAGIFTFAGAMSIAFGKPAFGAFLSDPGTAQGITAIITSVGALAAGALKGWEAK